MNLKASEEVLKRIFYGNSVVSIVVYIVILYLLLTFVVFPAVYAFTPITYVSVVVSPSMSHSSSSIDYTYYYWLSSHGFTTNETSRWPFGSGIGVGSLVVAYKSTPQNIQIGDVIIYRADVDGTYEDVIHRVINETIVNGSYFYTTKGDANPEPLSFEHNIPYSRVIGKVETVIPYLGYPRYLLYMLGLK